MENLKTTDLAIIAKSFYLLGDTLDYCYDCKYCRLNGEEMRLMGQAYDVLNLTARSYHRILKVARTIADLDYSEEIKLEHLQEAIGYRTLDRKYWGRYV